MTENPRPSVIQLCAKLVQFAHEVEWMPATARTKKELRAHCAELAARMRDCGIKSFKNVAPARPDDAAERVRLEAECAKFRAAIRNVMRHSTFMTPTEIDAKIDRICGAALATHPPQPGERDME